MYVAGKTTLDTLSILLTEFRAFSESQIARVTHLLRPFMPTLDNKNSHLLQVQSSPLFSVNWRCDSLKPEKRISFVLPPCPGWSACWGWTQWSWENYHSLSDLQTVSNKKILNLSKIIYFTWAFLVSAVKPGRKEMLLLLLPPYPFPFLYKLWRWLHWRPTFTYNGQENSHWSNPV